MNRDQPGELKFEQRHLEAILETNHAVSTMVKQFQRYIEERDRIVADVNTRLEKADSQIDCTERSILVLQENVKPIPAMEARLKLVEWAWVKITGFSLSISAISGIITAVILYLIFGD